MEAAMTLPYETERPIVSDNIIAVAVYLLYCLDVPGAAFQADDEGSISFTRCVRPW
jgi:hypothetical protein